VFLRLKAFLYYFVILCTLYPPFTMRPHFPASHIWIWRSRIIPPSNHVRACLLSCHAPLSSLTPGSGTYDPDSFSLAQHDFAKPIYVFCILNKSTHTPPCSQTASPLHFLFSLSCIFISLVLFICFQLTFYLAYLLYFRLKIISCIFYFFIFFT